MTENKFKVVCENIVIKLNVKQIVYKLLYNFLTFF